MKPFLNIFLLFASVLCFGQNISNKEMSTETSGVNKKMSKQAIQNNFNVASIVVYQENAEAKIKDLYSYFQLLSGNESEAFKNQVMESIKSLFGNTAVMMDNMVLDADTTITLDAFLQLLKSSKHHIQLLEIEKKAVQENSFVFSYTVLVNSQKKNIQQQVFFYPVQKQFGNKTKEVWEYTLGPLKM
ncbi:hypothetical protein [Flavobacterium suncheonense]|uniref:hypothetical protein n=1 Tax=Flavobacterium suncheonense TaxID=350894 RepID=UPI003FA39E54